MGARESRAQNPEDADRQAGPPDYYALLEVEETATADEIRVRYFGYSRGKCSKYVNIDVQEIFQTIGFDTSPRQES